MNINDKLKELKKIERDLLNDINDLEETKVKELQQVEKKYDNLLAKKRCHFKETSSQINELIKVSSTFNLKDISNVLSSLMTICEDKTFVTKSLLYYVSGALCHHALLIIDEQKYEDLESKRLTIDDINKLTKTNFVFELFRNFDKDETTQISFYEIDNKEKINENIKSNNFKYIKQFIDYVINYRLENDGKEISLDELNKLKREFIRSNLEEIKSYYEFLDQTKKEEFEKSLEYNVEIRNKKLQKVLEEN